MALLVPFYYHLWYDVVLDWGLNPVPPARTLQVSTLPLGHRGSQFSTNTLFTAFGHTINIQM